MLLGARKQPLATRIFICLIFTILLVLAPITIFIYSYGEKLTTDNLMNQLSVSMGDIRIRFDNTMEGVKEVLSSPEIVAILSDRETFNRRKAASSLSRIGFGYEDSVIFSVVSADGSLSASTISESLRHFDAERLEEKGWHGGMSYESDNRYRIRGNTVVLNIARRIYSEDGEFLGYALADVFGDSFVHFADPALVNAACLYDPESGMISSLTYLDSYGSYDEIAPFAGTSHPYGESYDTRNGGRLISFCRLTSMPFYIAGYLDITPYSNSLDQFNTLLYIVIFGVVSISVVISILLSGSIVRPIHSLISAMSTAESGNLMVRVDSSNIAEMSALESKFNEMIIQIDTLMAKNKEESEKVAEAERKALEAQMNPHFLYNTLNVIRSLARMHGEKEIEGITIKLGRLLRYAVDNHDPMESLENSFLMVESYLDIQKVRFGDKLHTTMFLSDQVRDIQVPKLMIQPLVENAITHGLESKIGEWELEVLVREEGGMVHVTVRDNGIGFDVDGVGDFEQLYSNGHSGIHNVYKRVRLCYAERAEFHISSQIGKGTRCDILIPEDKEA